MASKSKVAPVSRANRKKETSMKITSSRGTPRGTLSSRGNPRSSVPRRASRRLKESPDSVRGSSEPEAKTMDELLAQTKVSIKALTRGQKVKGKVVEITKKNVTIDIGGKSEGLVAEKAFNEAKDYVKTLKVGDEVTASVIIPETPDGFTILSLRDAQQEAAWEKILKAKAKGEELVVIGKFLNPSGLIVEVEGLVGFVPNSQFGKEVSKNPKALVGGHFKTKVIEAERYENKIVLSEKEVSEAEDIKLVKKVLKKVKEGEIYEGKVAKIYGFGCFVKIEIPFTKKKKVPIEGLVHVSELSWEKVEDPKDVVSEGDKVKVKVLEIKDGKMSLSIKQAQKDPWENADKIYKKDSKAKGKITKVSNYGVFVQLEPGVEGLIHMTKIPPGTRLKENDEVGVYIEEIDVEDRRLSLGLVLTKKPVGYK